jgi:hypothetical protein
MSLTKQSVEGNNVIKLFPAREGLVSDIPPRDGKRANLFYSVGLFRKSSRIEQTNAALLLLLLLFHRVKTAGFDRIYVCLAPSRHTFWKRPEPEFIDPVFRENKPKTLGVNDWKRVFWACFRKKWVYKFGHRTCVCVIKTLLKVKCVTDLTEYFYVLGRQKNVDKCYNSNWTASLIKKKKIYS